MIFKGLSAVRKCLRLNGTPFNVDFNKKKVI